MSEARIVLTSVGSAADARRIAKLLVEERLAACVSVTAVDSCYAWEGKVVEEGEALLVIKTSQQKVGDLERRFREIHPYSVPEFVAIAPDYVAEPYAAWLRDWLQT